MNVFVCDYNPAVAAKCLADKHVVKMIVESVQILSTAEIERRKSARNFIDVQSAVLMRPTHAHHPCTIKAVQNDAYYLWLVDHAFALCDEYFRRYTRVHKCDIDYLPQWKRYHNRPVDASIVDRFPCAMPDEFKTGNAVDNYRAYLTAKYKDWQTRRILKWTKTKPPEWFK